MVHVDVVSQPDNDPHVAVELLELKENDALMTSIESEGLIGWLKVKSSHPLLFEKVIPYLLGFPTTWLIEAGFSAANDVLTKKRNLLQIKQRGDIRLKLNQGLNVELDKLIRGHQPQCSY